MTRFLPKLEDPGEAIDVQGVPIQPSSFARELPKLEDPDAPGTLEKAGDAYGAFKGGFVEGLNPFYDAKGERLREMQENPYWTMGGSILGGLGSLYLVSQTLGLTALPQAGAAATRVAAGAARASKVPIIANQIAQRIPRYMPRVIQGAANFSTHTGIFEGISQLRNNDIDVAKLGTNVLNSAVAGGMLGALGATSMPLGARIPSAAGLGYTAARFSGEDHDGAVIQGAVWGLFEAIGGSKRNRKLRESAVRDMENLMANEYIRQRPTIKETVNGKTVETPTTMEYAKSQARKHMEEEALRWFPRQMKKNKDGIIEYTLNKETGTYDAVFDPTKKFGMDAALEKESGLLNVLEKLQNNYKKKLGKQMPMVVDPQETTNAVKTFHDTQVSEANFVVDPLIRRDFDRTLEEQQQAPEPQVSTAKNESSVTRYENVTKKGKTFKALVTYPLDISDKWKSLIQQQHANDDIAAAIDDLNLEYTTSDPDIADAEKTTRFTLAQMNESKEWRAAVNRYYRKHGVTGLKKFIEDEIYTKTNAYWWKGESDFKGSQVVFPSLLSVGKYPVVSIDQLTGIWMKPGGGGYDSIKPEGINLEDIEVFGENSDKLFAAIRAFHGINKGKSQGRSTEGEHQGKISVDPVDEPTQTPEQIVEEVREQMKNEDPESPPDGGGPTKPKSPDFDITPDAISMAKQGVSILSNFEPGQVSRGIDGEPNGGVLAGGWPAPMGGHGWSSKDVETVMKKVDEGKPLTARQDDIFQSLIQLAEEAGVQPDPTPAPGGEFKGVASVNISKQDLKVKDLKPGDSVMYLESDPITFEKTGQVADEYVYYGTKPNGSMVFMQNNISARNFPGQSPDAQTSKWVIYTKDEVDTQVAKLLLHAQLKGQYPLDLLASESQDDPVVRELKLPVEPASAPGVPKKVTQEGIEFVEHDGGYQARTLENAKADVTLAIAIDFNTYGEKSTKNAVKKNGKTYVSIDYPIKAESIQKVISNLNRAEAKTLNIAGNGIYNFDVDQSVIDKDVLDFMTELVNNPGLNNPIQQIVNGGQTGIDEAGAKAALALGIPTKILAPKGWVFRVKKGAKGDIADEKKFKERFYVSKLKPTGSITIVTSKGEYDVKGMRGPGGANMNTVSRNDYGKPESGWLGNPYVVGEKYASPGKGVFIDISDALLEKMVADNHPLFTKNKASFKKELERRNKEKSEAEPLTREQAIELFRVAFMKKVATDAEFLSAVNKLRGKTVGYYKPELPNHLDVVRDFLDGSWDVQVGDDFKLFKIDSRTEGRMDVWGMAVKSEEFPQFNFFTYRGGDGRWYLAEATTGRMISSNASRSNAIRDGLYEIRTKGSAALEESITKLAPQGFMPQSKYWMDGLKLANMYPVDPTFLRLKLGIGETEAGLLYADLIKAKVVKLPISEPGAEPEIDDIPEGEMVYQDTPEKVVKRMGVIRVEQEKLNHQLKFLSKDQVPIMEEPTHSEFPDAKMYSKKMMMLRELLDKHIKETPQGDAFFNLPYELQQQYKLHGQELRDAISRLQKAEKESARKQVPQRVIEQQLALEDLQRALEIATGEEVNSSNVDNIIRELEAKRNYESIQLKKGRSGKYKIDRGLSKKQKDALAQKLSAEKEKLSEATDANARKVGSLITKIKTLKKQMKDEASKGREPNKYKKAKPLTPLEKAELELADHLEAMARVQQSGTRIEANPPPPYKARILSNPPKKSKTGKKYIAMKVKRAILRQRVNDLRKKIGVKKLDPMERFEDRIERHKKESKIAELQQKQHELYSEYMRLEELGWRLRELYGEHTGTEKDGVDDDVVDFLEQRGESRDSIDADALAVQNVIEALQEWKAIITGESFVDAARDKDRGVRTVPGKGKADPSLAGIHLKKKGVTEQQRLQKEQEASGIDIKNIDLHERKGESSEYEDILKQREDLEKARDEAEQEYYRTMTRTFQITTKDGDFGVIGATNYRIERSVKDGVVIFEAIKGGTIKRVPQKWAKYQGTTVDSFRRSVNAASVREIDVSTTQPPLYEQIEQEIKNLTKMIREIEKESRTLGRSLKAVALMETRRVQNPQVEFAVKDIIKRLSPASPPDAIIQAWRSLQNIRTAVVNGHDIQPIYEEAIWAMVNADNPNKKGTTTGNPKMDLQHGMQDPGIGNGPPDDGPPVGVHPDGPVGPDKAPWDTGNLGQRITGWFRLWRTTFNGEPIPYLPKYDAEQLMGAAMKLKWEVGAHDLFADEIWDLVIQKTNSTFVDKFDHLNKEQKQELLQASLMWQYYGGEEIRYTYQPDADGNKIGTMTLSNIGMGTWSVGRKNPQDEMIANVDAMLRIREVFNRLLGTPMPSPQEYSYDAKKNVHLGSWAQSRPSQFFWKDMPDPLKKITAYIKEHVEDRVFFESMAVGLQQSTNSVAKIAEGYAHVDWNLNELLPESSGSPSGSLATLKQQQSKFHTAAEANWSARSQGLKPIEDFAETTRRDTSNKMRKIVTLNAINKMKQVPNPEYPSIGYITFAQDPAVKLLAKQLGYNSARDFLSSKEVGYTQMHNAEALVETYRGAYNVPWVHASAKDLMTQFFTNERGTNKLLDWINNKLGFNKRMVMFVGTQAGPQIASSGQTWLDWEPLMKSLSEFYTGGGGKLPYPLLTEGIHQHQNVKYKPFDEWDQYSDDDLRLLKEILLQGGGFMNPHTIMKNLYNSESAKKHPLLMNKTEDLLLNDIASKYGMDSYVFKVAIPRTMLAYTKAMMKHIMDGNITLLPSPNTAVGRMLKRMGLADQQTRSVDRQTAMKYAIKFCGDTSGLADSANIYSYEKGVLQLVLFSRDFNTTFFRQNTKALFPFWKKFHRFRPGLAGTSNWLLLGDTPEAEMEVMWKANAKHFAKLFATKFFMFGLIQFGASLMGDMLEQTMGLDTGTKREEDRWIFNNPNFFTIRMPFKDRDGRNLYLDPLIFREVSNWINLYRDPAKFAQSKLSWASNATYDLVGKREMRTGEPWEGDNAAESMKNYLVLEGKKFLSPAMIQEGPQGIDPTANFALKTAGIQVRSASTQGGTKEERMFEVELKDARKAKLFNDKQYYVKRKTRTDDLKNLKGFTPEQLINERMRRKNRRGQYILQGNKKRDLKVLQRKKYSEK